MIELPERPSPNGASPSLIDFGMILRPATGAAAGRIDRKGSRYRVGVSYPPMKVEVADVFVARLLRAKSEGLRIPYPLLRSQGSPGSPVVDGAGQSGTTLNLRGLNPGYAIKEGFWLSIVDASGQHYLHNVHTPVMVGAGGTATIGITPELRVPFADGATVNLAVPMIEGFVVGNEWGWAIPVNRLIAIEFEMEEAG
jgi:hypothetical protein